LLSPPLVFVAAVLFLFEEVLWGWVSALTAAIGRWPAVARIEAAIGRLPPYVAILLLAIPWAVILPVKLAALWLLATGQPVSGVLLFALGELVGVGFLARIYTLCRPSLSTLAWFVRIEGWVLAASAWSHRQMERIGLWRLARARIRAALSVLHGLWGKGVRGWLRDRMKAAYRLVRMQFQR
jgi:hypothetical protein